MGIGIMPRVFYLAAVFLPTRKGLNGQANQGTIAEKKMVGERLEPFLTGGDQGGGFLPYHDGRLYLACLTQADISCEGAVLIAADDQCQRLRR
jgi:hypothetical protein